MLQWELTELLKLFIKSSKSIMMCMHMTEVFTTPLWKKWRMTKEYMGIEVDCVFPPSRIGSIQAAKVILSDQEE